MQEKIEISGKKKTGALLAGSGTVSGLFALVGKLAFFVRAQPYFMGLTGVLIAVSFMAAPTSCPSTRDNC